ncbi:winged helix-turn-helix domain-containing protein [Sulfurospirillum sp.]|uniref:winged helix-turn-helix domain-containing protein n=1 Tax=Sulfurospirillum sp. TaxID=2053622 RepID=UPI002FDED795
MKIFFLDSDINLQNEIDRCLNKCRFKIDVKKTQNEHDIFDEISTLESYSLFILNLQNPADTKILDFIRTNAKVVPILLILESDMSPQIFQTLSSYSYNDIIIKKFSVEEIVYRIYKLCHIWNNNVFYPCKGICFDFKKRMFIFKDNHTVLGKKEALLLKYLFLKSHGVITCAEIVSFVYENEIVSNDRIRALVKQLRDKLPCDLIRTLHGKGYQIINFH